MKKFFIFTFLLVALMIWLEDWTSSGRMDAFIEAHADPAITPHLVYVLGESHFALQETKGAVHYYRWLIAKYPDYKHIPRARFHLGESYMDNSEKALAMEQYVVLKDSYSATDYGRMGRRKWELSRY